MTCLCSARLLGTHLAATRHHDAADEDGERDGDGEQVRRDEVRDPVRRVGAVHHHGDAAQVRDAGHDPVQVSEDKANNNDHKNTSS